jgi:hypothetical protein
MTRSCAGFRPLTAQPGLAPNLAALMVKCMPPECCIEAAVVPLMVPLVPAVVTAVVVLPLCTAPMLSAEPLSSGVSTGVVTLRCDAVVLVAVVATGSLLMPPSLSICSCSVRATVPSLPVVCRVRCSSKLSQHVHARLNTAHRCD